ncbi:MAG: hypothetical protein JXR96_24540 [Deltaproteobacteria bacterium]|nr:hypothetical protein [Deltaproteobacteria bacterium]
MRVHLHLVLGLLALAAGCQQDHRTPPTPRLWPDPGLELPESGFLDQRLYLRDTSSWAAEGCGKDQAFDARHMGDFGLGNGHVFALSGYACPLSSLHTMAGPDYQQEGAFFPDSWSELELDGQALEIDAGHVFRVRGGPILVSHERAGELDCLCVSFAPAGYADGDPRLKAIVRAFAIRNSGYQASGDLVLRTADAAATREGRTRSLVALEPADAPQPEAVALGSLSPGEERVIALAYVTSFDGESEAETAAALRETGLDALLEATCAHWAAWSSRSARLESPDPRVDDLLDGMRVTVRSQQTYLGGVSPMSRYSLMWIRDTAGAVRFFARLGLHEEARAMLDYYHRAAALGGDIKNAVRLDRDEPDPPEPDWASMPPFEGRCEGETPSYLPLMARWYAQASGDDSLVDAQYAFLRRALLAQNVDADGLLPFSGDETYRGAMAMSLGLAIEHDWVGCCLSANSSFLFAAAAEALAREAELRGLDADAAELRERAARVRRGADAAYWDAEQGFWRPYIQRDDPDAAVPPFEDVSVKPLWTGYAEADDPQAVENLLAVMALLGREDGFLQSPLHADYAGTMGLDISEGVYTGMMPGYFLYNLALIDHPTAALAFDGLALAASPSGMLAEYQVYDDHSALQVVYERSGSLGDLTARYRPWEGGICLDALVFYLTGFEPDARASRVSLAPRLPNGWPWMRWTGLRVGELRFDLLVEELGGLRRITVAPQEGELEVVLDVLLGEALVERVEVGEERLLEPAYTVSSPFGLTRIRLPAYPASRARPLVASVQHSKSDD